MLAVKCLLTVQCVCFLYGSELKSPRSEFVSAFSLMTVLVLPQMLSLVRTYSLKPSKRRVLMRIRHKKTKMFHLAKSISKSNQPIRLSCPLYISGGAYIGMVCSKPSSQVSDCKLVKSFKCVSKYS